MENNELMHHGIPGMKWGVRRYQNRDGTLTAAGKKRYQQELAKLKAEAEVVKNKERTKAKLDKLEAKRASLEERKKALNDKPSKPDKPKKVEQKVKYVDHKSKPVDEMTDAELKSAVNRLVLESQYEKLNPPTVSRGKRFMQVVGKDVVAPALVSAGKKALENALGDVFAVATDKVGAQVKKASDTTKKAADKAKADKTKDEGSTKPKSKGKSYQAPQADFKDTWVYDDNWWNTPASSSTTRQSPQTVQALPSPKKKKKRK